ncbi:hypothetical protein [Fulvivirga lutea]|uniref:Erythromycin esterase family protein n=1 Tax=Fulvivirga lutea TaxID=2810512 RepID=A0A975A2L2_9BACT|nr:hypothetical protein [Fulvivirga lutea]QSE98966.1 hypothetical protein JR347_07745 [Fulvivirga lutea]
MILRFYLLWLVFITIKTNCLFAQEELSAEKLLEYSYRFTINDKNTFSESTKALWKNLIGESHFVGVAEKHHSTELSKFTAALLPVLNEIDFNTFALELGPNSAEILNEYAEDSVRLSQSIRYLNRKYGKKRASKTPLVFVNRESDALFMDRAQYLNFEFWGLDQEYAYSYEMLLDRIQSLASNGTNQELYKEVKEVIHKNLFKSKIKREPIYCWYQSNKLINEYFEGVQENQNALKVIEDLRLSWEIYCKEASGIYSSQQRADYLKSNFDFHFEKRKPKKILLKMGNVHLTHDISPFGVNDLGKHITEKAIKEGLEFVNIRFFNPYLNGKYKGNNSSLKMLQSIGLKDQWTVVDLRPIRKLIINTEIQTSDPYLYEVMNYDILILAPDDKYDNDNNY